MTPADVASRVAVIRMLGVTDDERAHAEEDALHVDVLTSIAAGTCEDPRALARAALETLDLGHARWCA